MNSISGNFIEVFKTCFCFEGKLDREKYWSFMLMLFLPYYLLITPIFLAGIILLAHFPTANIWTRPTTYLTFVIGFNYFLLSIIYFVLTLGPSARRLRDANFSPWFLFLHLLFQPFGSIVLLVLFCMPTKIIIETKQDGEDAPNTETASQQPEETKQEEVKTEETKTEEN